MSSVTTTLINTANGSTPLTLSSGNTSGPSVIVTTNDNITLKANSTTNTAIVNTTFFTSAVPLVVNNNVTAGVMIAGTDDVSREIQISNGGAVVGYDGTDAYLEGGTGKGVSLYVNATAKALDIDPTQTATFSNNLIVTNRITSNTMTLGNSSVSPNGYVTLPSGIILQWGSASVSTSISTITFATPFTSVVYSVTMTPLASEDVWIVSANTTAFRADADVSTSVYYMAIGV